MKKIILSLFCIILLVGTISAFDFDNVKNYYAENKTVEIRNSILGIPFLKLNKVAEVQLTTPQTVYIDLDKNCEYREGNTGYNCKVAEISLNNFDSNSKNIFNEIKTYSKYNMQRINKNFVIKYFKKTGEQQISEPYFDTTLNKWVNYSYTKDEGEWKEVNRNEVYPLGITKIGLFTNVTEGDKVEWIPKIMGVTIPEWANYETAVTDTCGASFSSQDTGTTGNEGMKIQSKIDGKITQIIKHSLVTTTSVNVYYENGTLITNAAFSGDTAIVNIPIEKDQILILRRGSSPYNNRYTVNYFSGGSEEDTNIIWLKGVTSGSENSNNAYNFQSITTQKIFSPNVTLQSPTNNLTQSSNSVTFKCYANYTDDNTGIVNLSLKINGEVNYTVTNASANQNLSLEITRSLSNGDYSWSCDAWNDKGNNDTSVDERSLAIDSSYPTITINKPEETITLQENNTNLELNWTVGGTHLDSCWYVYQGVNNTVTCSDNSTNILITNPNDRNLTFYANKTTGLLNSTNVSWNYTLFINSQTFNKEVYDTSEETFYINVSTNGTLPVSASLIYNGTNEGSSTKTGNDTEMIFSKTIQIPTTTIKNNKTFFWNITLGLQTINTSIQTQTVTPISLTLCGSPPQDTTYINFTFKNETINEENINATISSSWTYWIGDGTVNKTLSFSNSSENSNYAFCFSPQNKTVSVEYELSYNNAESQQRVFSASSTLSNTTTNQVLYLLPTTKGLFSPFITQDSLGNSLSSVKAVITRVLSGSTITITSGFTDDSGFISFFLDPDITYTALFTSSGFADNEFTFVPTSDTRTVTMGSSTQAPNGSIISLETNYEIRPKNNTLINSTNYDFEFEVSSNQTITLISMNITNKSGYQLAFESDTSPGTLSVTLNTSTNETIIGFYKIQTSNETITISKMWIVGNEFVGEYSLFNQLTLYKEYNFNFIWQYLIVIISIITAVLFMSYNETLDTSESKIIVSIMIIWAWSLVGWLNNPAIVSDSGLAQFSKQYGIAILSTFGGSIFILRKLFRLIVT